MAPSDLVTRPFLAKVLGVDVRSVANYVKEGMPKAARGRYSLIACVQWYVTREREQARASKGLNDLDLARQRKTIAEARKAEMEAEALEGRLIPVEVVERELGETCDRLRACLMAVPSKYLHRIQTAKGDVEAQAVLEALRDETLRALVGTTDEPDPDTEAADAA